MKEFYRDITDRGLPFALSKLKNSLSRTFDNVVDHYVNRFKNANSIEEKEEILGELVAGGIITVQTVQGVSQLIVKGGRVVARIPGKIPPQVQILHERLTKQLEAFSIQLGPKKAAELVANLEKRSADVRKGGSPSKSAENMILEALDNRSQFAQPLETLENRIISSDKGTSISETQKRNYKTDILDARELTINEAEYENIFISTKDGKIPPYRNFDTYDGIKYLSKVLKEHGYSRKRRLEYITSFKAENITYRISDEFEYGLRYFDNLNAFPKGRYLFRTFPVNRDVLALKPEWNKMLFFKQWKIKKGTLIFEGAAAPQGEYLSGGIKQMFILNPGEDLLEVW